MTAVFYPDRVKDIMEETALCMVLRAVNAPTICHQCGSKVCDANFVATSSVAAKWSDLPLDRPGDSLDGKDPDAVTAILFPRRIEYRAMHIHKLGERQNRTGN